MGLSPWGVQHGAFAELADESVVVLNEEIAASGESVNLDAREGILQSGIQVLPRQRRSEALSPPTRARSIPPPREPRPALPLR